MISNHHTEVDPLAETWSEEEIAAMVQEEDASFGTTRGQRRLLMSIVVLGGAAVIVGMRLLTGGPAGVQANPVLDGAIDGFVGTQARAERAQLGDTTALKELLELGEGAQQVPWSQLQSNPFRRPTALAPAGDVDAGFSAPVAAHRLQQRLDQLEVSMVMRGHVTMALVSGMHLPLGEAVQTDDGLEVRLISVGIDAVNVELHDPASGTRLRGVLAIGGKRP